MMPTIAVRRWAASMAGLSAHIPYVGAIALIAAAPFEKLQPELQFQVRGVTQELTNVEVVILVVLAIWVLWHLVAGQRLYTRTTLTGPALFLLGVMVVSSVLAPDYREEALLFTARFATGFLVYLFLVNVVTGRRRLVGLLVAAGATGAVVAGMGILEYLEVPSVVESLEPFRAGQHLVGGEVRITSTLQYPTITSMYLEITFSFTLGLLLLTVSQRRWWAVTLAFVALGLMAEAIILTLSRSGLIVMVAVLAVTGGLWLVHRGIDSDLWPFGAVAVMVLGLLGYRLITDSMLWLRLTTENDLTWYRAQYAVPDRLELQAGQVHETNVTLTNRGRVTWEPGGDAPFRLAYHWLDVDTEQVVVFEGLRTNLPRAVGPGESIELQARVQAPRQPGEYQLAWDMVQEGRVWFSVKDSPSAHTVVMVGGSQSGELESIPTPARTALGEPSQTIGRRALWGIAAQMLATRPLLGIGPDNFRLLYGRYAGLEQFDQGLHTNNTYIEFFVDVGLLGGILFLWLLWRLVTSLSTTWEEMTPASLPVFSAVSGATVAFLVHGLVDYFFEFTSTYLMIWLVFGLVAALPQAQRVTEPPRNGAQHADRI